MLWQIGAGSSRIPGLSLADRQPTRQAIEQRRWHNQLAMVWVSDSVPRVVLRDPRSRRWLSFSEPREIVSARHPGEVLACLSYAVDGAASGQWAVGFIAYEAASAFDSKLQTLPPGELPLAWFAIFDHPSSGEALPGPEPARYRLGAWRSDVTRDEYLNAHAAIREEIVRGNTYQVNYTFRLRAPFSGDPWALFLDLVHTESAGYPAFIDSGAFAICSASPELFFDLDHGLVTARPMKGTAPRGRTLAEDEVVARELRESEKNRAENVMIVDLLRNDIGRVARPGSVTVPALFELERHPTLWQMTSTVTGATDRTLVDVMRALFPCGSVTGAPKRRTMEIIAGLEASPRGVYCGAIGVIAPGGRARFSIAIRTVTVDRAARQAEFGVGSGIVWDSTGTGEYDECLLKSSMLTKRAPTFSLIESLRWAPESGYWLMERHLERLADSATYFQFAIDRDEIRRRLESLAATLPRCLHKVRVLTAPGGEVTVAAIRIEQESPGPVELGMAVHPVDSADVFLFHKTTRRAVYEQALAERPDSDDVLLFNERGEITETCTANIAVARGGEWLTPPVECGLLAGTERARLIAAGTLREAVIHLDDVRRADALAIVNSVRLWRPARLRSARPMRATHPISPTGF